MEVGRPESAYVVPSLGVWKTATRIEGAIATTAFLAPHLVFSR